MKKEPLYLTLLLFLTLLTPAFAQDAREIQEPKKTPELRAALADLSYVALSENKTFHQYAGAVKDPAERLVFDKVTEHLHRGLAAEQMSDEEFTDYVEDLNLFGAALWLGTDESGRGRLKLDPTDDDPPSCTRRCRLELIECISVLAPENPGLTPLCVATWEICLLDCISPF